VCSVHQQVGQALPLHEAPILAWQREDHGSHVIQRAEHATIGKTDAMVQAGRPRHPRNIAIAGGDIR